MRILFMILSTVSLMEAQWATIQRIQDDSITTYIAKNDRMTITIDHVRRSKPSQFSGTRTYENVCNDGFNRCVHQLQYKEAATYYYQIKQEWYKRQYDREAIQELKKITIGEDDA